MSAAGTGTDSAAGRTCSPAIECGPITAEKEEPMPLQWRTSLPAALVAALAIACDQAPPTQPDPGEPRFHVVAAESERHLVVLRDGADPFGIATSVGAQPVYVYRVALNGFSAPLSDPVRRALERHPLVRWIEPVRTFELFGAQQRQFDEPPGQVRRRLPGGSPRPATRRRSARTRSRCPARGRCRA
jgi:hypothetical protein